MQLKLNYCLLSINKMLNECSCPNRLFCNMKIGFNTMQKYSNTQVFFSYLCMSGESKSRLKTL